MARKSYSAVFENDRYGDKDWQYGVRNVHCYILGKIDRCMDPGIQVIGESGKRKWLPGAKKHAAAFCSGEIEGRKACYCK